MIKDNQKYFNRLLVLLDALVITVSYLLAWFLWLGGSVVEMKPGTGVLAREIYFSVLFVVIPGYLILYNVFDMYTPKRTAKTKYEVFNIIKANTVGLFAIMVLLYAVKLPDFSRGMIAVFFGINIVLEIFMRKCVRFALRYIRKKGYNIKHILLVGYSRAGEEYIDKIRENPEWGYVVCGILDDRIPKGTKYKGVEVIGEIDQLSAILADNNMDEIGITLALEDYDRLEDIVNICEIFNSNLLKSEKLVEKDLENKSIDEVQNTIYDIVVKDYNEKLKDVPKEIQDDFEKAITLRVLDKNWMNQLDNMEQLKEGIGLRGYAQTNPLQAYALEGFQMFDNMLKETNREITTYLLKAEVRQNLERHENKNIKTNDSSEGTKKTPKKVENKIGRNDPCPCGSGKKYKNCHGR